MLTGVDDHFNGLGVENWDSEKVEAYEVANAHMTYTTVGQKWSLTVGGNNIFDENYWVTGFFGSVPEVSSRHYADGSTWYLTFKYSTE